MDHNLIEVGTTVLTIAGSAFAAIYHLGKKMGVIVTKLEGLADDVNVIRTNELHHINERFINIERVLMEGKNARQNQIGNTGGVQGD